jgi:IS5 family transposase
MNFRKHEKGGNLFSSIEHQQLMSKQVVGVLKIKSMIDWDSFLPTLIQVTGYDKKDWSKGGNLPFHPLLMFKILILQSYHGLSDDATEYQISDRLSFMNFLDLQMGDSIPDAKTIWDFKELIEKDGRDGSNKLFENFRQTLAQNGLIAKEGSIIDASFVDAPKQRNSREENKDIKEGKRPPGFEKDTAKGAQKDCDARWTKKNNETHYGYKNHTKVDLKSKLIDSYVTTTASTHDSQVFEELLDEKDKAVLADSAYLSEENDQVLLDHDLENFVMRKAYRNKPLSEEDHSYNKTVSRMRVRIEHVFGRMKYMGADYFRRIGLSRAKQHNALCNLTYNMDRYAFIQS